MSLERQLSNVVDRDQMHRLIDELPDDGQAVLVVNTKSAGRGCAYWIFGDRPMVWDVLGLLQWAIGFISFTHHRDTE